MKYRFQVCEKKNNEWLLEGLDVKTDGVQHSPQLHMNHNALFDQKRITIKHVTPPQAYFLC